MQPTYCFRRTGNVWEIRYGDEHGLFTHLIGFEIIAHLLQHPRIGHSALELLGRDPNEVHATHTDQPAMDCQARDNYHSRMAKLDKLIDEAKQTGATGRVNELTTEKNWIIEELKKNTGLRGRSRNLGPKKAADSARVAVRRDLDRVYDELRDASPPMPKLAKHLDDSIKPDGCDYAYCPDDVYDWTLDQKKLPVTPDVTA